MLDPISAIGTAKTVYDVLSIAVKGLNKLINKDHPLIRKVDGAYQVAVDLFFEQNNEIEDKGSLFLERPENISIIENALVYHPIPLSQVKLNLQHHIQDSYASEEDQNRFISLLEEELSKDVELALLMNYNQATHSITQQTPILFEIYDLVNRISGIKEKTTVNEIMRQLEIASLCILSIPSEIGGITITRKIGTDILEWVNRDHNHDQLNGEDNALMFVGSAGCGKSVIIKQLYTTCNQLQIPILVIKADLKEASDFEELSKQLNLSISILDLIDYMGTQLNKPIIVIDQLDSLSQYLSMDRKYIHCYIDLIRYIRKYNNINLIISCRKYDLQNDDVIRSIKASRVIEVSPLTEGEIISITSILGIDYHALPANVKTLCGLPYNLHLISELHKESVDVTQLTTSLKIHQKIWEEKIEKRFSGAKGSKVKELVRLITARITKTSVMHIPKDPYLSEFLDVIRDLVSDSILVDNQGAVSFYHASLYDFCFARHFIRECTDLVEYVLKSDQGFFIRPQIKMILDYLRDLDIDKYIHYFTMLLGGENVRFHIKLLLIDQLGFRNELFSDEEIVSEYIFNSRPELVTHFIDAISSPSWLNVFLKNNRVLWCLTNANNDARVHLISKLSQLSDRFPKDIEHILLQFSSHLNPAEIHWIVLRMSGQPSSNVMDLLINTFNSIQTDDEYSPDDLYKLIVRRDPKKGIDLLFSRIKDRIEREDWDATSHRHDIPNYWEFEAIKNCLKDSALQKVVLSRSLEAIHTIIQKNKFDESPFYRDRGFYSIENFESNLYQHWAWFTEIKASLCELVKTNSDIVKEIIDPYTQTLSHTVVSLLLQVYSNNVPVFIDEIFKLALMEHVLTDNGRVGYYILSCIESGFMLLNEDQQLELIQFVMRCPFEDEVYYLKKGIKENIAKEIASVSFKEWFRRTGYYRFRILSTIGEYNLSRYPEAISKLNVLTRKFGIFRNVLDTEPKGGVVGPPLESRAYQNMTTKQWLRSMKLFNSDYDHHSSKRGFLKGGLIEHSRVFEAAVRENPDKFYNTVMIVSQTPAIDRQYLAAGIGGLVDNYKDIQQLKQLLFVSYKTDHFWCVHQIIKLAQSLLKQEHSTEVYRVIVFYVDQYCDQEIDSWEKGYYGNSPLTAAINSTIGTAIWALLDCADYPEFVDDVFEVLERNVSKFSIASRVCLLHNMYGLIRSDKTRSYELTKLTIADKSPIIIEEAIRVFYYLMTEYDEFVYENVAYLIESGQIRDDSSYDLIGRLCVSANVWRRHYCSKLLQTWIAISNRTRESVVPDLVGLLGNEDNEYSEIAASVLRQILEYNDNGISRRFDDGFRKVSDKCIQRHNDFLFDYISKGYAKNNAYHLLKYLVNMSSSYPDKVFQLVKDHSLFETPDLSFNAIEDELVNIYITIYNYTKDKCIKDGAIRLFDSILQNPKYNRRTREILDSYDLREVASR